ncbi:HTH domain-containing protein [Pedobacter sp. AW1-32]|uniref:HTH domain-containing protein n=1 Tax=Pedobacter sp. AW1-32 TaxID=3383026 RepID=UPI003FEFF47A
MPSHNQKLQDILFLVKQKRLLNARHAAMMLGCSERTIKSYLKRLRASGYDISYEKSLGRYHLDQE